MKRLISTFMVLLLLIPASSMIAADTYTMYRLYKNPQERAAVMQKVREARTVAQKKLQAGAAYARAKTAEGWSATKEFAKRHKKKLITGAVIGALWVRGKHLSNVRMKEITEVFRNNGIDIDRMAKQTPEAYKRLLDIGFAISFQRFKSEADLKKSLKVNEQMSYDWTDKALYGHPAYYKAYKELAGFSSPVSPVRPHVVPQPPSRSGDID